jgi:hypothetical protein
LIATYFQFSDFMELLRQRSGTKVTKVNAGPSTGAAGKRVCCAQDDTRAEESIKRDTRSSLYFQHGDARE